MRLTSIVIVIVVGLVACDEARRAPDAPVAQATGALVDEVAPGVVFISPTQVRPRDFGDFVVTSDPTVRIERVGAPAGTPPVAVFTRLGDTSLSPDAPDEQTRRIRAVLQDGPGDPQDLDDDLNPVGFFQIRWKTEAAHAGQTFRLQVVLPDGRVAGVTDVYVGQTRADLRKIDPTQALGVLAGQSVNIRFRVDAEAVDGDGDGVLDWGDNCPKVANRDQADSDQDGQGDACEACVPTQCPPGQMLDPKTCGCTCGLCPAGQVADPQTCACACDLPAGNPCAGNFVLDPTTCKCACPTTDCAPGQVLDAATCACRCAGDACSGVHVQDPATCGCMCPQIARGEIDPCADAGPGRVLDPRTCACGCPETLCPSGMRLDEDACACECASACLPGQVQDANDCTCRCAVTPTCDASQVFDPVKCVCVGDPIGRDAIVSHAILTFDDPAATCSGLGTATVASPIAVGLDPADVPLAFGPAPGCSAGTCVRTHATRIAIDAHGAAGVRLDRFELADPILALMKVRCWVAYREGEGMNGEIRYLATQDSDMGAGGGLYGAPPEEVNELYVVCDGALEPALATCPQVSRHLKLTIF